MSADPSDRLGELLPLVSFERQDLVSQVLTDEDLATLKHLARKGTPDNSLKALTSDLTYLEAWCAEATTEALPWPVPADLVLKFVAHHLYDPLEKTSNPDHGMPEEVAEGLQWSGLLKVSGPHAPSTVRRRLASWSTLHRLRGLDGPFSTPVVREAVKRAAKASGWRPKKNSRKAIGRELLREILITCEDGSTRSLRDRALLLFAFASGGRRRSEVAALRVEDLQEEPPVLADPTDSQSPKLRAYRVELGRTKTTTAEEGASVVLIGKAADALTDWLESQEIAEGHVFRAMDRWDNVLEKPITPEGINFMIKRRLEDLGHDPSDYSAHGLRAGFLTEAAKDGIPLPEAMRLSQHRSVQQAASYYNEAEIRMGRSVRLMEKK